MKRIVLACLAAFMLSLYVCAGAERSDIKNAEPTEHALSMQAYLGKEPCWDEDWMRVELNRDETVPVYSAMYGDSYRGEDDTWEVSLNKLFHVLAVDGRQEWLLIEYAISENESRIGWIEKPEEFTLSEEALRSKRMRSNRMTAVVLDRTAVTDDPYGSQRALTYLEADAEVECLGWADAYYAYVMTVIDNQTAFGFVPLKDMAEPESLRMKDVEQELIGAWQFTGGAEMLGYGIVLADGGRYMLCTTDDFATFPPEDLMLSIRSSGRYEVMRNDRPMGEFWNEDAPYALILRDDAGGVSRYVMDYRKADGAELIQDKLMLYAGMGGGNYGRVSGDGAQTLLDAVANTKVFILEDHSEGRVRGKVGVTDGRYIRADIELDREEMPEEIWLCESEYNDEYDEWRIKNVIGVAQTGSELFDGYYFEGDLPEGTDAIRFYEIYEDGAKEELLALSLATPRLGY